ncbi:hypothetical protein SUDANB1_05626 [Streptomyces sp. enrichment culture]|uniref:hypothetical protein n=1 Tax=Streptomyces sp. enrichment culture TaxID=1795815 RepID=UPI003F576BEF
MTGTDTKAPAFRILGTTGDVTNCEHCHRRGLRKTVILLPLDEDGAADGDPIHYGTGCAATALRTTSYKIRTAARAADIQATIARRTEQRDRAAWALPRLEDFRANLARRMAAGDDADTVATAHANRLGSAVWRYAPELREQAEAEAREAYAVGGLDAVLALYDRHIATAGRLSRLDPVIY